MSALSDDEASIVRHLVARGVVTGDDVSISPMLGGVSSDVFEVRWPGGELVVKRALARLRVAEEWLADTARIEIEARALRTAAPLIPDRVPGVIDLADGVLVMERAPRRLRNWKTDLLSGRIDPDTAEAVGQTLGALQARSATAEVARAFADQSVFVDLRVAPFFDTVAERQPHSARAIRAVAGEIQRRRQCLVHGDFTPKNLLVDAGSHWVLDWEVAHFGDAAFDPAMLIAHLLLKAIRSPEDSPRLRRAARAFVRGYAVEGLCAPDADDRHLATLVGCLLLARVDGRSPVEYLSDRQRDAARRLGAQLVGDDGPPLAHLLKETP